MLITSRILNRSKKFLLENCIDGDLLITMGAGNIVTIGEDLVKE